MLRKDGRIRCKRKHLPASPILMWKPASNSINERAKSELKFKALM
jgi:hypothetical protein